jgi:hypothetical protein
VGIEWLTGRACTRVYEHYPHNFSFEFGPGVLRVDCLWRIVAGGRLVRVSQDHGQQFGLPAPLDAYAEAESLLRGRRVVAARIRQETADLVVEFDEGLLLEVLSDSSGYEPWQLLAPGVQLVAIGGGGVGDFSGSAEQVAAPDPARDGGV